MIEIYRCGNFIYYYNNRRQLGRLRAILKRGIDNEYQLRIQEILYYDGLPRNFKGESRQIHSHEEVWIKLSQLVEKANVVIEFQHKNILNDALRIREIIYKYNGR